MVVAAQLVVQLSKEDILFQISWKYAQQAVCDIGLGVRTSGRRYVSGTHEAGDGRIRLRRRVKDRVHFAEAVIGAEKEQLILDDGRAHAPAKLVLLMDGLGVNPARLSQGIQGVQVWVAQIVKQVAMQLVRAGLGNRVHHPAGSLTQFRAVIAGSHRKFSYGIGAIDVGNNDRASPRLRKKGLAVVGPVYRVPVVERRESAEAA